MTGTIARQHRKMPVRSMSRTRRHSSGGYSHVGAFGPVIPAFATRMSMPPKRPAVAAAAASTCSTLTTSTAAVWTSPSDASSPAAVWSIAGSQSQSETRAPERKKRSAIARPMPWAPPVTTARRPVRSN